MDRNQKFLKRLDPREFAAVETILRKILSRNTAKLNIKKLAGYRDVYRIRTGNIRIIFLDAGADPEILEISRRNEKTYKNY